MREAFATTNLIVPLESVALAPKPGGNTDGMRSPLNPNKREDMMTRIRFRVTQWVWQRFLSVALAFFCVVAAPDLLSDTLITNARVIDGTGATAINASVRISGVHIIAVGDLVPTESDSIVDAGGLVLAPGFIDTHSHSDRLILTERAALAKITQGITTAVVGQDLSLIHI